MGPHKAATDIHPILITQEGGGGGRTFLPTPFHFLLEFLYLEAVEEIHLFYSILSNELKIKKSQGAVISTGTPSRIQKKRQTNSIL